MADKNKRRIDNPERLNRLVTGSKIIGDVVVDSCLRLDGEIEGNVRCNEKLVVGQEGKILGDVFATEAEINGLVKGKIQTENLLVLSHTAIIKGDIFTERLVIEDGAKIEGSIQTGSLPKQTNASTSSSSSHTSKEKTREKEPSDVVY